MKKKISKLVVGAVLLVGIFGVSACGSSSSAKDIVAKGIEKLEKVKSSTNDVSFVMDMTLKEGSEKATMSMEMKLTKKQMVETKESHNVGEISVDFDGDSQETEVEMYVEKDGKEYNRYTRSDDADWEVENDSEVNDSDRAGIYKAIEKAKNLEKKGEGKVKKEKTDIVEATINGKYVNDVLGDLLKTNDGDLTSLFGGEIEYDDIEMDIQAEFYQDSGLPAKVSIDMSKTLEKTLNKTVKDAYGSKAGVEINEYTISMTSYGYDELKKKDIEVPEDAKEETTSGKIKDGVEDATGPWESFVVNYDGKEIKLPISYEEIKAMGIQIDSSSEERKVIEPKSSEYSVTAIGNDGEKLYLEFYNDSDVDKPITECLVVGVIAGGYDVETSKLIFPGDVKIGMSEEDLNKVYKEYTSVYEGSTLHIYTYEGESYRKSVEITIDVDSKKVSEIDMRNTPND